MPAERVHRKAPAVLSMASAAARWLHRSPFHTPHAIGRHRELEI
jgi:hypothetical protein